MLDTWMRMWDVVPERTVTPWTAVNDFVPSLTDGFTPMWLMSMTAPVAVPAIAGAAAANATAAHLAGFWLAMPAAGSAAIEILTGETKTSAKVTKPARRTKLAAKTPAPKAKPAPARAVTTAASKVDDRPAGLDAPRAGKADDLKRISGVGPKLESVLNDLGIYHFDQIATWKKKEIAWVDDYLRFKGRIERDGWIAQAKTFAKEVA